MINKSRKILLVVICLSILIVGGIWDKQKNKVAGISTTNNDGQIAGLVIPHHELAREIIIDSLERINQKYDLIVILSPNHYQPQGNAIVTNETGEVLAVTKEINNKLVAGEHGINIPLNFLMHYYPEAEYIPIIFSNQAKLPMAEAIADTLVNLGNNHKMLIVAAVDFSHEKMSIEAINNNEETIEAISKFDYRKLFSFSDDHLDSPGAVAALMKYAEKTGAGEWETWYNTHGAILTGNPTLNGTGYVIGTFRKSN